MFAAMAAQCVEAAAAEARCTSWRLMRNRFLGSHTVNDLTSNSALPPGSQCPGKWTRCRGWPVGTTHSPHRAALPSSYQRPSVLIAVVAVLPVAFSMNAVVDNVLDEDRHKCLDSSVVGLHGGGLDRRR